MSRSQAQTDQYNKNRRRKKKEALEALMRAEIAAAAAPLSAVDEALQTQLKVLAKRTKNNLTDADGDIDFAYRNMALPNVSPLEAPSTAAWQWYIYARSEPNKFLEICAKREDAKSKMAGTITNQRMEDDRRNQFEVIDRIEKQLTRDVEATIKELMEKFPGDVLRECRKFDAEWKEFLATDTQ